MQIKDVLCSLTHMSFAASCQAGWRAIELVRDLSLANWAIKVWHQFARHSSRKPVLRQVLEMVAGVRFELTTFGL